MLIWTDIKKFLKHILLEIFFSFDLALCKKLVIWCFSQICILSLFVTNLILITSKNVLENKHKEAKYKTAILMKFSSKFRLSSNLEKNINFSFCFKFFWGVTKFEAFQLDFVTKLYTHKPSPNKIKTNTHPDPEKEMAIKIFHIFLKCSTLYV